MPFEAWLPVAKALAAGAESAITESAIYVWIAPTR
jgi:hypothetical protein